MRVNSWVLHFICENLEKSNFIWFHGNFIIFSRKETFILIIFKYRIFPQHVQM